MGNVYSITLCDRDLHHVPDDIYKHHKHVAKLMLRRNNIQEIPPEIRVLTNLIELSLRDNLLTGLPHEMTSLRLLQKLSIANNRIHEAPEPIAAFSQLTWLSLASNTLASLPDSFALLQKLTSLDLQRNRFNTIPGCIFQLRSLNILLLQKNRITSVSPLIGQCSQLVSLNLSYNRIQHLPAEMVECRHLQHLLLSVNSIQSLPAALCEAWTSLLNLDLHTNDLKSLPDQLGCMRSLRRLNLAINKIEEIPASIGQLQLLEWLNLNDNKLVTLPSTMDQMHKLVKMGIVQNKLQTLPAALARLSLLYKLDCRRNDIEFLPSAFKEMQGIHSLLLEENPLSVKYGVSNYSRQPASLLELAARVVLESYCSQENNISPISSAHSSGSSYNSPSISAESAGMGVAQLLPMMTDLGLTKPPTLLLPSSSTQQHPKATQKSRYSFFSRACATVHPQQSSKAARTSTRSSTWSNDSSESSTSSASSSSSRSPPSLTSPSSAMISSSLANGYLTPGYATVESGGKFKRQKSSPCNVKPGGLFRRSSRNQHGKHCTIDHQSPYPNNHHRHQQQQQRAMTVIYTHQQDTIPRKRYLSKIDRLLDPEVSLLPLSLINLLALPTTACDYCGRRMCTSGWVDFLEPAKLGNSSMIIPVRHRMCSLQCIRQQHRDSFGGELTDLFETTDFHIGPNGEMIGTRPIVPGELDEYMIEAVQEAAEAADISITHLLEQHQQLLQEQQQQAQQQVDPEDVVEESQQQPGSMQSTLPGALPIGSISITALNQMTLASNSNNNTQQQQPSSTGSLGPTSVIRQTTARLRRSLSRPIAPIEIQVDTQGQLRRVVYRQNKSMSHRRRFLETFRSLSQVGQSTGLGGNGVGGGLGGLGVLAAAGLGHHPNVDGAGADGGGGGNQGVVVVADGPGWRGGASNRAPGEVMNVTTFAVELERF